MMNDTTDVEDVQEEQAGADAPEASSAGGEEKVPLKPLKEEGSSGALTSTSEIDIAALMDVPVTLSVEIGKKRMPIQELVSLTPGSIVELDKEHSDPLDLLVNGTLIARGEVVVIGQRFGLRLVDVVSPKERLQKLK